MIYAVSVYCSEEGSMLYNFGRQYLILAFCSCKLHWQPMSSSPPVDRQTPHPLNKNVEKMVHRLLGFNHPLFREGQQINHRQDGR